MLCWGNASFGQLGLGGIDEEVVLEPRSCSFFKKKRILDVGCGRRHTVFVIHDGTVYTCGCNDLGQLGHEKGRKRPEQVSALDAQNIIAVSCGEMHTLSLNDEGQVFAWGLATDGQMGFSSTEECVRVPRNIKSLSEIRIIQVACGYYHSLALSNGSQIFSWGQNKYGQLGLGPDTTSKSAAQQIQSLNGVPFIQIAAGGAHTFALTLSGAVFGWGRNKFGQLGLNDEKDRHVPTLLKSLRTQKVVYICCGEDHTATLTKEGGVFTFGAGGYGQLGHNSTNHEINPRKVFELMGNVVTQIACGRQHTLAFVPSSGKLHSFGLGGNGQLGTGFTSNRKSPSIVKAAWAVHNVSSPPGKCQSTSHGRCIFCMEKNLIPRFPKSPPDIEAMRVYITLTECPLLSDPNNYVTLAIPFAASILRLEKTPLKVIFVGEEAIDAGGVRKEFFLLIMRELLDPKYGMFQYYEESRLIWFSFQTFEDNDLFHLIGIVCGLAIYNFTIVDLPFPLALYKKLLKYKTTLDDLKELIPDVGRLVNITEEKYGVTQIKELIPNGTNTSVTNENRHEFVEAYVDYVFNKSVAPLFDAFFEGFHKVCGGKVLQLFQPNELQAMVIGNANYDWKELEKNTEYKGEYGADHPTIKFFWAVFHELSLEKKKQFLLFLTGSDRIPILGMKSLKIVIQPTGGGNDYLPVAHTCFNLLDLPKYTDQELLQNKLIQAIDHYEGFSLV
uniref:HECT and RLD domain containing E3 ubiquitin protein ligase 4 n=1 Tax=Callorhinchus milii TaxID=7868 RepID=A0A4W3GTK5_CALMI